MRQVGRAVQFRYQELHRRRGRHKARHGWVGRISAITKCTETFFIDVLLGRQTHVVSFLWGVGHAKALLLLAFKEIFANLV